ncbi:pentatricopeptide repeat-containing protein At5g57250, mitochondrial isoform X2 [Alnus glutinosa]|uniref:pentatricopeptide repeat-containing protein At5g57250, mitochondrial isoform X2 n=1 Tax=Alnus glutinosa TaxID=3517 RepID=UPI002D7A2123|nr:pentatricopeptide repeat-containing protein At5g57250, mitochondrial isoform X2 [Alnus glutinosa]
MFFSCTKFFHSSSSSFSSNNKFPKLPPLQTLLKRGFTPTLKSINQFLLFLLQTHRFNSVIHFFSQMCSNQIKGNSQTHSILAWALLKSPKFEEAGHFMMTQKAKALNFPKTRMWDSLIQDLCIKQNNPENALLVLRFCLRSNGILCSSFTFCSLIHRFSSQGSMGKAVEVLELMTDEKVRYPFNNFVCSSVISGFCKIGKPELAVGFFENAMSSGALRPNVVTYTALVSALGKLGRVNEVDDLVCTMEKEGLPFDVVFYSSWICGYIAEGVLVEVLGKKKQMLERGINPDSTSYTILIDGFSKLGGVEKAVGFLNKMTKDGIKPNLVTYTAIILGFCKKGKMAEALAIFKMVEDLGIEVDEFMYATLINGFCKRGNFDRVFHLLDEMEKRGINPSIVTYNTVINGLCKFGRTSEADEVSKGIAGDVITYSTLLHGYIEEENITGTLETKRRLEEAGVCMDVVMCNILIKALFMVGAFEDAYVIYKGMPEMDLVANFVTYSTMIDGYCKVGRIGEALEIFDEFRRTSISSVACYNCILNGLCKNDMVDMATEVFIELNEKGLALDVNTYMMLIKAIFKAEGADGVFSAVCRLQNLRPEIYGTICNDAIFFLCKRGFPETASEVYIAMRMKESTVTSKSYYSILKELVSGRKVWLSRPIMTTFLKEYGLVEPRVYRILAYYLCLTDANRAIWFLNRIKEKFSAVTFPVSVFKALVKDGRVLDAYKLVVEAENRLPIMDVVDYTIIVDGLCKGGEGFLLDGKQLFERMVLKGFKPNTRIYNSLIDGVCKFGKMEEAFRLLSDMEIKCLKPDEFTVSAVINGYSQKGDMEGALGFFTEFKKKGISPDFLGFLYLIRGLCAKGRMEEARSILREMLQSQPVVELINRLDTEVETESVESFLLVLCEQGGIQEAVTVLDEVASMFLPVRRCHRANHKSDLLYNLYEREGFGTVASKSMACHSEADLGFGWSDVKVVEKVENYYRIGKRFQFHNFDSYYSRIASHCSRGEVQKAGQLAKEMLSNLDASH